MACLQIQTAGMDSTLFILRLGANRVGRSPDADFQIAHSSVSGLHCELILREDGVTVRDLNSTNGTFLDDLRIADAELCVGQRLRLGEVELLVESTEAKLAIPVFNRTDLPAPPVTLADGNIICPRHRMSLATFQCSVCKEVMCDVCVHLLRRKGGKKMLQLCPLCSEAVEPIGGGRKQSKKSLFSRVAETVRLKFKNTVKLDDDGKSLS